MRNFVLGLGLGVLVMLLLVPGGILLLQAVGFSAGTPRPELLPSIVGVALVLFGIAVIVESGVSASRARVFDTPDVYEQAAAIRQAAYLGLIVVVLGCVMVVLPSWIAARDGSDSTSASAAPTATDD